MEDIYSRNTKYSFQSQNDVLGCLINVILYQELFKCLRQIHEKSYKAFMLSKLVPVVGNICESNLGLDEDSSNVIMDEVDVIVNSAANTTFDERMMDPIVLCYGKGQLTGFLVDPNGVLDVVPSDMVVNATLAAMARHGMDQKRDINVYQIASSVVNPLVFQDLARLLYEHYSSSPCIDSKGRPIQVPLMKLFSSTEEFSGHLWRDAIQKSGLTAMASSKGKMSQKLENICRKSVEQAKYLANIYEPYTFYGGRFDNSNTERLMEIMSEEEKREFGFDVKAIDWKDYITNVHIPGLRRHVMKGRGMGS